MSLQERLAPNYAKLDVAFRSIGYSFESAVADVIDNSIDAGADAVLVRIITKPEGAIDLAIWDNGKGMDSSALKEAMRFGSDVSQEIVRLGKFGLGLKLASLSQARGFHAISTQGNTLSGRAWLEDGIAKGFICTVFTEAECKTLLKAMIPDCGLKKSGTVVYWSNLYRVGKNLANPDEHAQKLMRQLERFLALAFHRFLAGRPRKICIELDIFDQRFGSAGIPIKIDPLDPFSYANSGHPDFPTSMYLDDGYKERMKIMAHIWEPNSDAPGYKLPGGANSRQGFYFYRNNRLIQGGGWNGIREVEPHSFLARLEIDMPSDFDLEVSLDVKKVEIHLPLPLVKSIQKAKTTSGVDFRKYLSLAEETYRTRKITDAELPLIPSSGLPADLREFLHKELQIKETAKYHGLKIEWADLDEEAFFDFEASGGYLLLNRAFRKRLLHGLPASPVDAPVLKCLLFYLLGDPTATGIALLGNMLFLGFVIMLTGAYLNLSFDYDKVFRKEFKIIFPSAQEGP